MDIGHCLPGRCTSWEQRLLLLPMAYRMTWLSVFSVVTVVVVLPGTFLSVPFEKLNGSILDALEWCDAGQLGRSGAAVFYILGCLITGGSLVSYTWGVRDSLPKYVKRLSDAIAALALVHLGDVLFSTVETYAFYESLWIHIVFSAYFIILVYLDKRGVYWLLWVICTAATLQSIYAIVYYILGVHQFYTPGFGRRTSGTLGNPSYLYPLLLPILPVVLCCSMQSQSKIIRFLCWSSALFHSAALVFTYTRTAWLSVASATFFLGRTATITHKRLLYILTVAITLGALLVRTGGELAGCARDRSFWGRFAIWEVAARAAVVYPVLGWGLNSYPQVQSVYMTGRLASFHPINNEAKNLVLNTVIELGLLGTVALGYVTYCCWRLLRWGMLSGNSDMGAYAAVKGAAAGLLSLAISTLADTPILQYNRLAASFVTACLLGMVATILRQDALEPSAPPQKRYSMYAKMVHTTYFLLGICIAAFVIYAMICVWLGFEDATRAQPHVKQRVIMLRNKQFYVKHANIPDVLRDCLIAAEDKRFYEHKGVDWDALHRALRHNIRRLHWAEGGSTITMQTARYAFLTREKTLRRKFAEIFLALYIENSLAKADIIELHLNTARFGLGSEGIGVAACAYFGKPPWKLSPVEAAFLVGCLPHPPLSRSDVPIDFAKRRARAILLQLHKRFPDQYPEEWVRRTMLSPIRFRFHLGNFKAPQAGTVLK